MDNVIEVDNVTKAFRVHSAKNSTLKDRVLHYGQSARRDFVALKEVTLSVERGTTVGLIGMNGSGKSTLLKLMSRIIYPDSGQVVVRGRVSSLLELGAGFHPEFTGYENIFMNGALLGLSKREIKGKMDEIVEFSGLGDFLREPVRSYSSGMYMRLAFSVAVAVDPEVLLIDEILAVGDSAFQAKCMSRIRQLQGDGRTIVIVSHDHSSLERLCDKVVWMHDSRVAMEGEPVPCIQAYLAELFKDSAAGSQMSFDREKPKSHGPNEGSGAKEVQVNSGVHRSEDYGGGDSHRGIEILSISIDTEAGNSLAFTGEPATIRISFDAKLACEAVVFGFGLFTNDGTQCYGTNTLLDRLGEMTVQPGMGSVSVKFDKLQLLGGEYWLDVAVHKSDGTPYHYLRRACKLVVSSDISDVGICRLDHKWIIQCGDRVLAQ